MRDRFRVWVWVFGGNKVGNPGLPLSLLNSRVTVSLKLDMPSMLGCGRQLAPTSHRPLAW